MLEQVIDVQVRSGYRLFLRFDDGAEGEVDISQVVPFEGVFARLRDPEEFRRVRLDRDWGTVSWPGDLDLAPEFLHDLVASRAGA